MIYTAAFNQKTGWRVMADYNAVGGEKMDVCGAVSERIAFETAMAMNEFRKGASA